MTTKNENQFYVMTEEVINDYTNDPQFNIISGTSAQDVMDMHAKNVVYDYLSVRECPDAEEKADPNYEPETYRVVANVYAMRKAMSEEQIQDFYDECLEEEIDEFVIIDGFGIVSESYNIDDLSKEQQDELDCDKIEQLCQEQQANWQASQDAS